MGNTIKSIRIKYATLLKYVNAAKLFYTDRGYHNPQAAIREDLVKPLLQAVKQYESITNRKEMIYDNMLAHMLATCRSCHPTSLDSSILDWIILGRVTGARRSEWCQDSQSVEMTSPTLSHPIPEPKAFLLSDFEFFDSLQQRIYDISSPDSTSTVDYVQICWRCQKNGDNGQKIPFKRDYTHPNVCPVLAALRICRRALTLSVPSTSPIAVFCNINETNTISTINFS